MRLSQEEKVMAYKLTARRLRDAAGYIELCEPDNGDVRELRRLAAKYAKRRTREMRRNK